MTNASDVAYEIIRTPDGVILKDRRIPRGPQAIALTPEQAGPVGWALSQLAKMDESQSPCLIALDFNGKPVPFANPEEAQEKPCRLCRHTLKMVSGCPEGFVVCDDPNVLRTEPRTREAHPDTDTCDNWEPMVEVEKT